jgi:hypothetical protein
VVTSSAVDSLFQHQSGQTKDYKIGICSFSAMHAALQHWSSQTKNYKIGICSFSAMHAALRKKSKDFLFGSDKG